MEALFLARKAEWNPFLVPPGIRLIGEAIGWQSAVFATGECFL
jgi:hypothetical protein